MYSFDQRFRTYSPEVRVLTSIVGVFLAPLLALLSLFGQTTLAWGLWLIWIVVLLLMPATAVMR
jgi:hypothetical protein